jgi:hypothetical protein
MDFFSDAVTAMDAAFAAMEVNSYDEYVAAAGLNPVNEHVCPDGLDPHTGDCCYYGQGMGAAPPPTCDATDDCPCPSMGGSESWCEWHWLASK